MQLVGLAAALALVAVPATANAQDWTGGYSDGIASPQGAAAVIYDANVKPLINCAVNDYSVAWDMVADGNSSTDGWTQTGEGIQYQFTPTPDCSTPYYFVQFQVPNGSGAPPTWVSTAGPANNTSTSYWSYEPNHDSLWCGYVEALGGDIKCYYTPFYPTRVEFFGEIDFWNDAYTQGENSDHANFNTMYTYTSGGSWVALPNDLTYCSYPAGSGCSTFPVNYYGRLATTGAPNFDIWDCRVDTNQC